MTHVPFLFFEKANFRTIEPVVRTLAEGCKIKPIIVKGFDYKEISGQITPHVTPKEFDTIDILADTSPEESAPAPTLPHCIKKNLETRNYFSEARRYSALVATRLETLLDQLKPRFAIVPEDVHYAQGRLACLALRMRGIPAIAIVPPFYQVQEHSPMVGDRLADIYFVQSNRMRDRLLSQRVDPKRIFVWGCPHFRPAKIARTSARKIVYACQGLPGEEIILNRLHQWVDRQIGVRLEVRPHPELSKVPGPATTLEASLGEASVLVAQSSLALYEATELGVPIVRIHFSTFVPPMYLPEPEATEVTAKNYHQLFSLLEKALSEKLPAIERRRLMADPAGAERRIAEQLENWVEGGKI